MDKSSTIPEKNGDRGSELPGYLFGKGSVHLQEEVMQDRRGFIAKGAAAVAVLAVPGLASARTWHATRPAVDMLIHKNPGCMCCDRWAAHLEAAGLTTEIEEHADLAAFKDEMEIPTDLRSCHTGVIGDYVVEGHVPAEDVLRLLDTTPEVRGIAVPGMPIGSPGMESGDRVDAYEVIAFGGSQDRYVFATHG